LRPGSPSAGRGASQVHPVRGDAIQALQVPSSRGFNDSTRVLAGRERPGRAAGQAKTRPQPRVYYRPTRAFPRPRSRERSGLSAERTRAGPRILL